MGRTFVSARKTAEAGLHPVRPFGGEAYNRGFPSDKEAQRP